MTPEETAVLMEVRDLALETNQRCGPCLEELKRHRIILDGQPGNGKHPGVITRVAVVEETCDDIKQAQDETKQVQAGQVKWLRTQLGLIIAAVLAIAGKWIAKG